MKSKRVTQGRLDRKLAVCGLLALGQLIAQPAWAEPAQPAALHAEVRAAVDSGLKFLRSQQDKKGSYGHYPGLTAMVVEAFALSHRAYREDDGPFVRRAVEYLLKLQKEDGAIFDQNLPSYNTALALLALRSVENAAHAKAIVRAQRFLVGLQTSEQRGYRQQDKFFGGIGYGSDERPDLSNLQLALEALKESGFSERKVYDKALVFLNRVQNRSESNDQPWAGDDGGFVYAPNESKAGGFTSYGSMTYAGLKSLMYCDVSGDDPRIKDARRWLKSNWTLEAHPGMGTTGLLFYYQTLAKTLALVGEAELVDARGRKHDWYAELARKLISTQRPDGSWRNDNPRHWEGNPILGTARVVLALSYGFKAWALHHGIK